MTSNTLRVSEALVHDIGEEELDFSDLFLCDGFPSDSDQGHHLHDDTHPPDIPNSDLSASSQSTSPPTPATAASQHGAGPGYPFSGQASNPGSIHALSPRIEITPSADSLSSHPLDPSPSSRALGPYRDQPCVSPASSNSSSGWPIDTCSPSVSPSISPANGGGGAAAAGLSALDLCPVVQGSAGTFSAHSSPGASPRTSITEETFLVLQHHRAASPLPHQRSRSVSPKGKRPYDREHGDHPCLGGGTPIKQRSRSPSPIPVAATTATAATAAGGGPDQDGSYHYQEGPARSLHQAGECPAGLLEDVLSSLISPAPPPKVAAPCYVQEGESFGEESCVYVQAQRQDRRYGGGWGWNTEPDVRRCSPVAEAQPPEALYVLPNIWPPYSSGHKVYRGLPVATVPSLEYPLPSQSGPYELVIHQQPKSHHRAHYETEGSRGAVKTPNGGHPVVQLVGCRGAGPLVLQVFIGMADERALKPHAFYQVHRITGKTVTTASLERVVNGTKVLEIALEPKNNMTALVDCAGILKLRNADIEQRNSETDIGRKNTRVRLVFRVHVPQLHGGLVSLQVASQPIECSQRSAQELPAVERQDLDECSVLGGLQMVLTGQNFTSDSKVIFSERRQDGQQIWEVEAMVDRDKTQPAMLFVTVPPYRDPTISHVAKVNFYVVNGKKKRSQPQHFLYTPLKAIKTEPFTNYHLYGCVDPQELDLPQKSLHRHPDLDGLSNANSLAPILYHMTNQELAASHEPVLAYSEEDELLFYPSKADALKTMDPTQLYHALNLHQAAHGAGGCGGGHFPVQQRHNAAQQHHHLHASLLGAPHHLSAHHASAHHASLSAHRLDNGAVPGDRLHRAADGYRAMVAAATTAPLEESDLFGVCVAAPGHQGYAHDAGAVLPGKCPPPPPPSSRCGQTRDADKMGAGRPELLWHPPLSQRGAPGSGRPWSEAAAERGVKQEHPGQAYLEDVNDIIKRDMGARSGGAT